MSLVAWLILVVGALVGAAVIRQLGR